MGSEASPPGENESSSEITATIIINGTPDRAIEFALARRLGYRALFTLMPLFEWLKMIVYATIAFVVIGLFIDGTAIVERDLSGAPVLLLQVVTFASVIFFLWRIFMIWSMAPGQETPPAKHERFSIVGDRLLVEFDDNRIFVTLTNETLFTEIDDDVMLRPGPTYVPMLLYADRFIGTGRAQLIDLLDQKASRVHRWNCHLLIKATP
jgi:hypothetical protein